MFKVLSKLTRQRPIFILIALSPLCARWLPGAVRAASRIRPTIALIKTVLYFPYN
jgi:hypothetical protein